ncbi:beta-ketoacyl-ACP synthase II [Chloroflexota bacterium]
MKRRVVVTGLGAITPLAIGAEPSWKALCQGESGIDRVTSFDATDFKTQIAGEIKDFNPQDFLTRKVVQRMDRFVLLALVAAQMALEDSKLQINADNASRVASIVGTAMAGLLTIEKNHQSMLKGDYDEIRHYFIPSFLSSTASCQIAMHTGARGPNISPASSCAAGTHAIGLAFKIIQNGGADAAIAGGAEAPICALMFRGLDAMGACSMRNDQPQKASRPFDKERDGFVTSEGAGILILEELGLAQARGATIYAEVAGFGSSGDAYHMTSPSPDGRGAAECMNMALDDANITPGEVDYVNSHGTSTIVNDISETLAIKSVFGEHSKRVAVSSNKSMIGHLLGASGAVEDIFSILSIRDGIIPPTINYETPDPRCDLDYVPKLARKARVDVVISNSLGLGGTNGTMILKRYIS